MEDPSEASPFETAWREVEATWQDPAAHRRFVAFCAAQEALHEAGRRYRTVRETDATRAEQAKHGTELVLAAAMQSIQLTRQGSDAPQPARVMRWLSLAVSIGLIAYALLALLRGASH